MARDIVDRELFTPQFDARADIRLRTRRQVDGQHVHRHAADDPRADAVDDDRRAFRRNARITVRIGLTAPDPKSGVATNYTTSAGFLYCKF